MNTIRLINFINSVTSGSIGVIICLILIYLILKKTAKEMKQYSFILLQSTLLDLFFANTSIFVDIVRKFAPRKKLFLDFLLIFTPSSSHNHSTI
jgi:hypothetical protein